MLQHQKITKHIASNPAKHGIRLPCTKRAVKCRTASPGLSSVDVLTQERENHHNSAVELKSLADALDRAKEFNKAFSTSQYKEHKYWVDHIEGDIPKGLRGTLLRNGPGLFEVGGKPVPHPFDGDGMICQFSFDGQGHVFFANKFVRTPTFLAERRTGKQQVRSAFNRTLPDGQGLELDLPFVGKFKFSNLLDFNVKDAANTMVLRWAGKTLALYESGVPHQLSTDLETLGTDNLGGSMTSKSMNAHLRVAQESDGSQRAILFAAEQEGTDSPMTFYEYDKDFKLLYRHRAVLPGAAFGFFHDFAVTEHYYVLVENRLSMDMAKLFTQVPFEKASIAECLTFRPDQPCKLHLIPRPGKGAPAGLLTYEIPGPSFFTFHHAGAFELDGQGRAAAAGQPGRYLVLDSCSAGKVDFSMNTQTVDHRYYGDSQSRVELYRTVVDLSAPVGPSAVTRTSLMARSCEFPTVGSTVVSKPYQYVYLGASGVEGGSFFGPNQVLMKVKVEPTQGAGQAVDRSSITHQTWAPSSPYHFPGEPAYVPRTDDPNAAEDDGWLMSMVYDSEDNRSHLVIIDAATMKEQCKLYLKHHIPAGLHGMFSPEYCGPVHPQGDVQEYDIRQGV